MRNSSKFSGKDKNSSSESHKKSTHKDDKRTTKKEFSRTGSRSKSDSSESDWKATKRSDRSEKPVFERDKKKPFKFDESRASGTGNTPFKKSRTDQKPLSKTGKTELDSDKKKYGSAKSDSSKKYNPRTAFGPKKPKGDPLPSFSEDIRLNKYLANAGICSRREADVFIQTGLVKVNGQTITELGYKVKPGDEVKYDGGTVRAEKKRYVLLNKPKDFITTMDDPMDRKTVMVLVAKACKERIYPVGRLDRNTTGLLLFTNDGDLAKKLTHPRYEVRKLYHVETVEPVSYEQVNALLEGIELEDGGFVKADKVEILKDSRNREVGIEIHSGKYRVVRRMFETLGHVVKKLDRVSFAGLTKKDLPRGNYRHLTEEEVNFLRML